MTDLVERNQGRVAVAVRHTPLEHHKEARAYANEVMCPQDQGRFGDFARELFASLTAGANVDEEDEEIDMFGNVAIPERIDHALVASQKAGLDPARFETCRNEQTHGARIDKDLAEAKKAGVRGTPTLFVNGRKWGGTSLNVEGLTSAIDRFFPAK